MDNDLMVTLSFSSYSTNGLASVTVKVTKEFNQQADINHTLDGLIIDDDNDFEFSLILDDQSFPIYDRDFLNHEKIGENDDFAIKIPLKELFAYDREEYSSSSTSSSSETANELEPITEFRTSGSKWKENNSSTGERRRKSKGWNRICDLFRRKPGAAKMKAYLATPMEVFYVRNKAAYKPQFLGFFGRKY